MCLQLALDQDVINSPSLLWLRRMPRKRHSFLPQYRHLSFTDGGKLMMIRMFLLLCRVVSTVAG